MIFLKFSRFVGSSSLDLLQRSGKVEGCEFSCNVFNIPSDSSLCQTYLLVQWGLDDEFIRDGYRIQIFV